MLIQVPRKTEKKVQILSNMLGGPIRFHDNWFEQQTKN